LQHKQPHDRYVHLKHSFVVPIGHFVAAKRMAFRTCSDLERTVMRILEGAAMFAAMIGAQALAVGTILIH
jgi:hypothetical protein